MKRGSIFCLIALVSFVTVGISPPAFAAIATYSSLLQQGYKTGRLTTHPISRLTGWFVSKRLENGYTAKYFCLPLDVFYQGGKTGVGQLKHGQPVPMSVKDYEAQKGKPAISALPKLGDLLSGHLRPGKDVANACEATPLEVRVY